MARWSGPDEYRRVARISGRLHALIRAVQAQPETWRAVHESYSDLLNDFALQRGEGQGWDELSLRIRLRMHEAYSEGSGRTAEASRSAFASLATEVQQLLGGPPDESLHPTACSVRRNHAKWVRRAGGADAVPLGIDMYRQELERCEVGLGPDHFVSGLARGSLVFALTRLHTESGYDEALFLNEFEIALRESTLGPEHHNTLLERLRRATILLERIDAIPEIPTHDLDAQEAFAIADHVLKMREVESGRGGHTALAARRIRARALIALGQPERAWWSLRRNRVWEQRPSVMDFEPGRTDYLLSRALLEMAKLGDPQRIDAAEFHANAARLAFSRRGLTVELAEAERLLGSIRQLRNSMSSNSNPMEESEVSSGPGSV